MRLFGFGSKKVLADSERKILENAIEQVGKCSFADLYMRKDEVIDYQKLKRGTELEAAESLAEARIDSFIRMNNTLGYVIKNAHKWYGKLSDKEDVRVKEALATLMRTDEMISKKNYHLVRMGVFYYPQAICYEDEKKTREHLLRDLKTLQLIK